MGRISSINTGFWTSPQVVDNFTPEERYVYLYCLTNPRTNLCGCYEVSIKTIAFETGMERYEVRDILDRLQHRHGVICYDADTRELFIINWLRNHWNSSPRWQKNALRSLRKVKSRWLRVLARAQFLRMQEMDRAAKKRRSAAVLPHSLQAVSAPTRRSLIAKTLYFGGEEVSRGRCRMRNWLSASSRERNI